MEVCFVLVEPQMGENIGAVARILDNFGHTDLRIVAPRDGWPNPKATAVAAHANAILEGASICDSIEQAIEDCNYVLATSSKRRDLTLPHYNIMQMGQNLTQYAGHKVAILFGCERTGLTNKELAYADGLIYINTNAQNPSINLSHTVGLLAYELSRGSMKMDDSHGLNAVRAHTPLRKGDLNGYLQFLLQDLRLSGFFRTAAKTDLTEQKIRSLFSRIACNESDFQLMIGIINALKGDTRK